MINKSPYSHNDLLCAEDSSGQAQHPVLAGLRGLLPPARGQHQSPGVLSGGSFSGSTPRAQVLCAPGGWGGEGHPPRHRWGPARLTCLSAPSLLLCGIVAVVLQHYEEAEIFFEDACCLEPSNIVAWTLSGRKGSQPVCSRRFCRDECCFLPHRSNLRVKGRILLRANFFSCCSLSPVGLFYELQNNNIQAEMAFREAKKQLQAQLARERSISEGKRRKKNIAAAYVRSTSPGPEQLLPGNS